MNLPTQKIGFIGLGTMGAPMAEHLIKAGHQVYVYTRGKIPGHIAAQSAQVCANSGAVAQAADVIFIMVPDTPDVEAVLFADNGIASSLSKGKVVVDMSSISPIAFDKEKLLSVYDATKDKEPMKSANIASAH